MKRAPVTSYESSFVHYAYRIHPPPVTLSKRKGGSENPSLPKRSANYRIERPALAKPVIAVAMSIPAVTDAENTSMRRVPAVTGIERPVVIPLLVVPMATNPVSAGANVTSAPATGENVLLNAGAENNCAVTVTVEPTRVAATERLN